MNRGLTKEQAERGVQPKPLTKAEWQAMHETALTASEEALQRTALHAYNAITRRNRDRAE